MVKKNSLFYLVIVSLTMKMVLIDVVMSLFSEGFPFILHAQVDFFSSSPKPGSLGELGYGSVKNRVGEKARVIFFISPGCRSCPDEAAILEGELKRLGVSYEIQGVFLETPRRWAHISPSFKPTRSISNLRWTWMGALSGDMALRHFQVR